MLFICSLLVGEEDEVSIKDVAKLVVEGMQFTGQIVVSFFSSRALSQAFFLFPTSFIETKLEKEKVQKGKRNERYATRFECCSNLRCLILCPHIHTAQKVRICNLPVE